MHSTNQKWSAMQAPPPRSTFVQFLECVCEREGVCSLAH